MEIRQGRWRYKFCCEFGLQRFLILSSRRQSVTSCFRMFVYMATLAIVFFASALLVLLVLCISDLWIWQLSALHCRKVFVRPWKLALAEYCRKSCILFLPVCSFDKSIQIRFCCLHLTGFSIPFFNSWNLSAEDWVISPGGSEKPGKRKKYLQVFILEWWIHNFCLSGSEFSYIWTVILQ